MLQDESVKLNALRVLLASCPTCSRTSHVSCSTCSHAPHASCLTCSRALGVSYPTCLVAYVPPACLTYLLPQVPCSLRASCHTYLTCSCVPCVFLGCSFLELYVLFFAPWSLTCFRCFKPNMRLCISCLVAFMPFASCALGASPMWVFLQSGLRLMTLIGSSKDTVHGKTTYEWHTDDK